MPLTLDVRIDGFADPIGQLTRNDEGGHSFAYREAHLELPNAMPLSLSLPLRLGPYPDVITRAFFGNLLAERDTMLRSVMEREGIARDDIAGLLLHLGKDCPGAISIIPEGDPPAKVPGDFNTDYVTLSGHRMAEIVRSLHERQRLPADADDPSPLAGVQSKIAVTLLPDGRYAQPITGSGAPTTHILKVPEVGRVRDADFEVAAMELSSELLIPTAHAVVVRHGDVPCALVQRFDRVVNGDVVTRVHQEDFAQALGLPASLKYERRGTPERRFDVAAAARILNQTISPAEARSLFIRNTFFDLLIGNADAHAKNHAILHLGAGRVQLAPRYDLLPTRMDPDLTEELAYRIGSATHLDQITTTDFDDFMSSMGLIRKAARARMKTRDLYVMSLFMESRFAALDAKGLRTFADLIASNMRTLLPVLGMKVHDLALERDAAIPRGGG